MPESNSPNAYPQAREFMEQLADQGRLAIGPMLRSRAHKFRMQCYTLRRNEQRRNERIYEPGHQLYGASEWDSMSLRIEFHRGTGKMELNPKTQTLEEASYWVVGYNEGDLSEYQLLDPQSLKETSDDNQQG